MEALVLVATHLLEYILLTSPLVWELITDYVRIEDKGLEDNHKEDLKWRVGIGIISSVAVAIMFMRDGYGLGINTMRAGIYEFGLFLFLFDYVLNILRGKKLTYLRDEGVDGFMQRFGIIGGFFVRAWFLILGICVYYLFNWIVIHYGAYVPTFTERTIFFK